MISPLAEEGAARIGVRYARLEHLTPAATALTVALNLMFGVVLVAVEAWIAH